MPPPPQKKKKKTPGADYYDPDDDETVMMVRTENGKQNLGFDADEDYPERLGRPCWLLMIMVIILQMFASCQPP